MSDSVEVTDDIIIDAMMMNDRHADDARSCRQHDMHFLLGRTENMTLGDPW